MDAILGGLIGSILTIIITKVLDMIQKSVEHTHSLRKEVFIKKIEVAENAVLTFSEEISFFSQNLSIYQKLIEAPITDFLFYSTQLDLIKKTETEFLRKIKDSFGKVYLYFDIEEYLHSDNQNYKKFIEINSEIDKINNEAKLLTDLYKNDKSEIEAENKIYKLLLDEVKGLIPRLKELIELLEKARNESFNNMAIIKKEIHKYN